MIMMMMMMITIRRMMMMMVMMMMMKMMMIMTMMMTMIPVDSPNKGPIMLTFDITLVESKNNSRVSGDSRRHVPHVTSL